MSQTLLVSLAAIAAAWVVLSAIGGERERRLREEESKKNGPANSNTAAAAPAGEKPAFVPRKGAPSSPRRPPQSATSAR